MVSPAVARAQSRRSQESNDSAKKNAVPADARPPKGMCRIWIKEVPAAQQPAATDCATAVKNRPSNGRVLWGDDYADTTKAKGDDKPKLPAGAKGFAGVKSTPIVVPKRPPA
jgi:hypothetical protein